MAKSLERLKARELRKQGMSVKSIAKSISISKSSVSLWTRDIILSVEQLEKLKQREIVGREKGSLNGAIVQKMRRLKQIEDEKTNGIQALQSLTEREFFIAGIALYWAEGNKKNRCIKICNSDPEIIQLMISWFRHFFNLSLSEFRCSVGINEAHRSREERVKKYWSEVTTIPLEYFRKTSFKKVKNVKLYDNFDQHYGTLDLHVLKSAQICYKLLGLIQGLSQAGINFKINY